MRTLNAAKKQDRRLDGRPLMVSEAPPAVASPAAAEEEMAPSPEDGTTSIDLVEIDISGEDGAASSADGAAESTVELVGVQTSADRAAEAKRDAVSLVSPTPTADAAAEPDDGPPPHWEKARVAAAPAPAVVDESESECVKVAVRVRPLSAKENAEGSTQCVRFPGNGQIVIGKDRTFTFDSVFAPEEQQSSVYETQVTKLVDKVMSGFNATILAYGQTGSGKTHTMGSATVCNAADLDDSVGIIPRAMARLFDKVGEMEAAGDEVEVSVCFLEIYQEELYDLLTGEIHDDGAKGLPIREEDGEIKVAGATEEALSTCEGALECLQRGSLNRATGETMMNSVSSRSHAIFTVSVKITGERTTHSKLHFVDLAGSERAKRTGAEGARLKEGININQGLMTLGKVISALSDEKNAGGHVPYRESKLTRMLQDSLGGNSLTYMICCISPADTNFEETLNSLKYANRAKNIKNKPTINEESNSEVERMLRAQIFAMQQQMAAGGGGGGGGGGSGSSGSSGGGDSVDSAEVEEIRQAERTATRNAAQLEAKVASLVRENEELGSKLLTVTNDRDRCMSQLQEAGIETTNAEGETVVGETVLEEKNREIAALRKKVATLQVVADVAAQDEVFQKEQEQVVEITREAEIAERELIATEKQFKNQQDRLESEIQSIDDKVALKEKIMKELAAQAVQHEKMKSAYEKNIQKLQDDIAKEHKEKDARIALHKSAKGSSADAEKIKQKYEEKINTMRQKLSELKLKQKDAHSSLQLQKQQTTKLKQIEKDMETMKREKVDLVKRLKEDATQHREWKQKQELELRLLRRQQQKTQFELTKLENVREKQEIVLKRKHEEVAAAKKRVKELDRKARAGQAGKGRLLPAGDMNPEHVNTWLLQQVSECANEAAMRSSLKIEMMKRRALANKLSKDGLDDETMESLKEQLQFRSSTIQNLQQQLGDRDHMQRFQARIKRCSDIEEIRQVMSACITQSVHMKSDNVQLERAATVAEEHTEEMQQKLHLAELGFEKKCLESQQEYEMNMADLMASLAKQDEQVLLAESEAESSEESMSEPSPAKDKEREERSAERLRTMYNAVKTAHASSEREVKRMKKIQERADATVGNLREECAELAMDKMKLEATVQELESRVGEVTPREPRTAGTVVDPRSLKGLSEKEDARGELMRRSRTDSVVLARSSSSSSTSSTAGGGAISRSSSAASADWTTAKVTTLSDVTMGDSEQTTANNFRLNRAGMDANGPPAVTPREDDAEEDSASPKDESPRESRRKPMQAWAGASPYESASSPKEDSSLTLEEDSLPSPRHQEEDSQSSPAAGGSSPDSVAIWYKDATLSAERMRIRTLTVSQLKDELKACDGARTGKKSELMARLMDAMKSHWSETGTILSTTTTIVRSESNISDSEEEDEGSEEITPSTRPSSTSSSGSSVSKSSSKQLYNRGMINKMARSFSPARSSGNAENEGGGIVDHSQKGRSKRQPLTMVRQTSGGAATSEKLTPKDLGLLKEAKQLKSKHVDITGTNATRAPDGRLIRSSSEAERTAELSKKMYELEVENKRMLRTRKKASKVERVGLLAHTQMHVQKQRLKNGVPKEGIRRRESVGMESDESEYEPSDDEFDPEM